MQRNNLLIKKLGEDTQLYGPRLSFSSPLSRRLKCAGNSQKNLRSLPGFTKVNINRRAKIISGAALIFMLMMSGCSSVGLWKPFQAPSSRTEPARNNLYGDFDGWEPVAFDAKPFASITQHSFSEEGGDFDPDISADGNWIVISSLRHSPNPDIYIKRTSGITSTRLTSDPASEVQPCFSPQADKVAFASNRSGNWDIWVIGVDGTNPTQLTSSVENEWHPSWSPDGKQIVYSCLGPRSEQWELWIVDVENPGVKKWIGYGLFPAWCPNPKIPKIAFQQTRYRGKKWFSVWTIDLVDGEAKFPTEIVSSVNHACLCPSWSPEGDKLAYGTINRSIYEKIEPAVPQAAGEDIWIVDLDGRNNLRLTQSDAVNFSPCWSPDGNIYFCSDRKGIENIWSIKPYTVNFSQPKPVDLSRHPQSTIR
jgi:TolB protein